MRVDVCIVNLFYSEGKDRDGIIATYSCTPWSIYQQPHPASTWQFLGSIHSHLHRSVHMYHLICKHVNLMCTVQMSIVCRDRPACTMMCVELPLKQLAIRPPCFLTRIWAWLCKEKKIRQQYGIGFSEIWTQQMSVVKYKLFDNLQTARAFIRSWYAIIRGLKHSQVVLLSVQMLGRKVALWDDRYMLDSHQGTYYHWALHEGSPRC